MSIFHIGSTLCFFPASLKSSTYTDNTSLFFSELFPIRVPKELSQIAFPMIVLLKDDRTAFVQEERLDLPCWTMI